MTDIKRLLEEMVTDGAIIWSQNENIRRNTKILKKQKNKKKIVLLLWRRLKRILLLSGWFPFPLVYIPHCARKHLARLSTRNRWRKVLLLLHNRNQTTFSSNEKFARKSYFFSGIFSFLFLSNLVYIVGSIEKHSKNEKFGSNMFFSSIRFKCKQKPHTATLSTNVNILLCHK